MPSNHEKMRAALINAAAREQCRAEIARQEAKIRDEKHNLGLAAECDRFADYYRAMAALPTD